MDLFTQVKMAVSVKEAAEYYGLEVKRGNIKVMDCTLRDGGLVNNFEFTDEFVKDLYEANVAAGVDYMEFGYKADKDIFDEKEFCDGFINMLGKRCGIATHGGSDMSFEEYKQREYDKLADAIRENMDMKYIYEIMGL